MDSHIKVAINLRPILSSEQNNPCLITTFPVIFKQNNKIQANDSESFISCEFDRILTNDQSFEYIKPNLSGILQGQNLSIYSYGETNSGKTTLLLGNRTRDGLISKTLNCLLNSIKISD